MTISQAEWSRFMDWYIHAASGPERDDLRGIPRVLANYKNKLTSDGMQVSEAEALTGRLRPRLLSDPEFTRLNYNLIYSRTHQTQEPSAALVEIVKSLRPGKALDIGMGEGRNAIFLAQKGWDVTGIDLSDVGVRIARERSKVLGVNIDARVEDVNRFDLGDAHWDLVCMIYFGITNDTPNLHQRIARALRPGGLVLVEGVGLLPGHFDAVFQAWSKWEPTKLHLLRLEYRDTGLDYFLLQKPA
jgi:SAM-dependent methyltransferase